MKFWRDFPDHVDPPTYGLRGLLSPFFTTTEFPFAEIALLAVADPGFSRGGGREPSRGGVNTPNFPENCMKSKEFGRPGGGVRPSRPPP